MTYANHATDEVSTVIVSSKKTQNRDSDSLGCHEAIVILSLAVFVLMSASKTVVGLIILNSIGHAHHNKSQK